jgi:hypothetical protein
MAVFIPPRKATIFVLLALLMVPAIAQPQATTQPPAPTLVATPGGRIASGLNPPYLNSLPSAETVKKLIQGSDSTDTLERQVAVFNLLKARIQHHIAADRTRYRATPDEDKVTYAYSYAAWELEEGYKKTHTKEEADAFFRRHGQYESTWEMEKEIDNKLMSAAAVAENRANDRSALQQLEAHNEAIRRQNEEFAARAAAAAADPHGRVVLSNDPTSLAVRRCLELGGDQLECVGKGFGNGLMSMFGVDTNVLFGSQQRTGLTLAGRYQGANGFYMNFSESTVAMGGCGSVGNGGGTAGPYTISKHGTSYSLLVSVKPRPFTVVLGPDGNVTGAGATDIEGRVITGYSHYTEYTRRASDWQIVGQRDVAEPIYSPKLEHCTIGTLRSTGPVPVDSASNLFSSMFALMGDKSAEAKIKTYPAGMRILGGYEGPAGLKIQFALEGAVLDCQAAHAARQYNVENTASAVRVIIDNGGVPLALALQPDSTLAGDGTVDVAGRLVSGMSGNDVTFKPVRASCPVGTLAPHGH